RADRRRPRPVRGLARRGDRADRLPPRGRGRAGRRELLDGRGADLGPGSPDRALRPGRRGGPRGRRVGLGRRRGALRGGAAGRRGRILRLTMSPGRGDSPSAPAADDEHMWHASTWTPPATARRGTRRDLFATLSGLRKGAAPR